MGGNVEHGHHNFKSDSSTSSSYGEKNSGHEVTTKAGDIPESELQGLYCPYCGTQGLASTDNYCSDCGEELSGTFGGQE